MLLHIITVELWNKASSAGYLTDPSLETEGFIHCSFPDQVLTPANERFGGREDLFLLLIDPEAVEPQIVIEDTYGSGVKYPHIYGPLNTDAVRAVLRFPPASDGVFKHVPIFDPIETGGSGS